MELNTKHGLEHNNARELSTKQACTLAFIVWDKIYIVTTIVFDLSAITILIHVNPVMQAFMIYIQDYD